MLPPASAAEAGLALQQPSVFGSSPAAKTPAEAAEDCCAGMLRKLFDDGQDGSHLFHNEIGRAQGAYQSFPREAAEAFQREAKVGMLLAKMSNVAGTNEMSLA